MRRADPILFLYSPRFMSAATGADIESICSKCGDVWHVVVAKVGDTIARVQCKECGAQHRYRAKDGKVAAKAAPRPRAAKVTKAPVERFERPQVAADLTRPTRTYHPTERFEIGDRVEHPTFGQGVVEATPEPGKMTVFFPVGRKVLVHAKDGGGMSGLGKPRPFDHASKAGLGDAPVAVRRPADLDVIDDVGADGEVDADADADDDADPDADEAV